MKKTILKRTAAVLLAASMLFLFCGCGKKEGVKVRLIYDKEAHVLRNEENGTEYAWASVSYEPAYVGDPYADWDGMTLYEVKGWAPDMLLTEEFAGVGGLIYNKEHPLPSVGEMDADKIHVCVSNTFTTLVDTIEDKETIAKAALLLENGETAELPQDSSFTLQLKFASDKYDGLYYSVLYIEMGDLPEDDRYLYDRGNKRCVKIPDGLFFGILYGGDADTAESVTDENSDAVYSFDA